MNTALAVAVPAAPLDELMLAMDVVDTLRHEQALVEAELGAEAQHKALVERLKQLYAGQGIEVSEAVIVQGVAALKAERFVYRPPPPSFAVRLARLWIARVRWLRRIAAVGAVLGLGWGAVVGIGAWRVGSAHSAHVDAVAALRGEAQSTAQLIGDARRDADALLERNIGPVAAFVIAQTADARAELDGAQIALDDGRAALAAAGVSRDEWEQQAESATAARMRAAELIDRAGDAARAAVVGREQAATATGLVDRQTRLRARAETAGLVPAAAATVTSELNAAASALNGADVAAATAALSRVEADLARAEQTFDLRIVSREGERSGVWRHPADNPRGRNYYVIVEAIGADGRALKLDVLNEETQRTESVSRFGIRVPQAVYERVRADKQDNGLIDEPLVGAKRRGELQPAWSIETAGGTITRW